MITEHDFRVRHALSRTNQPYWGDLIAMGSDQDTPFTLVVGAGTSIDSGLPTWLGLVDNLVSQIGQKYRAFARADTEDLMRKADYLMQMIRLDRSTTSAQILRTALYQDVKHPVPGALARSIAALVVGLWPRVRVITTNFDMMLEVAIRDLDPGFPVEAYGLKDLKKWQENAGGNLELPVLHLHGSVAPDEDVVRGPVVLTESHFLRHGPKARAAVRRELTAFPTVFVGVSLTDPNLVGPLWDTRRARISGSPTPFTLAVVSPVEGASDPQGEVEYTLERARYLDEELGVKPIFLKSYTQLGQAVSELRIAGREPTRYASESAGSSLAYGHRFKRALQECYDGLGCGAESKQVPEGRDAERLSAHLLSALDKSNGSVGPLLAEYIEEYREDLGKERSLRRALKGEERFALFLWLRTRPPRSPASSYFLNLVGTSAYIHQESWSAERVMPIVRNSSWIACKAFFVGSQRPQAARARETGNLWNTVLPVQIRLSQALNDQGLTDSLNVGVITLNSIFTLNAVESEERQSILAHISAPRLEEVRRSLTQVAQDALIGAHLGRLPLAH